MDRKKFEAGLMRFGRQYASQAVINFLQYVFL